MRTFEHFPEKETCKICGTNDDIPCTLITIDGTSLGNKCEAVPVHVECVTKGDFRYNKEINIFYKAGWK